MCRMQCMTHELDSMCASYDVCLVGDSIVGSTPDWTAWWPYLSCVCARACVCASLTASEAYTKSYRAMTVTEIPMAGPLTAATRGLGKLMKASTNFLSGTNQAKLQHDTATTSEYMDTWISGSTYLLPHNMLYSLHRREVPLARCAGSPHFDHPFLG